MNYPRSAILLVPFGNSGGRGVSLHHGALVTIALFLGGAAGGKVLSTKHTSTSAIHANDPANGPLLVDV